MAPSGRVVSHSRGRMQYDIARSVENNAGSPVKVTAFDSDLAANSVARRT